MEQTFETPAGTPAQTFENQPAEKWDWLKKIKPIWAVGVLKSDFSTPTRLCRSLTSASSASSLT